MAFPTLHAALAAAAFIAFSAPVARAQPDAAASRVRIATAEIRAVAPTILVPATVVSRLDSDVAAETEGRVTQILRAGETVAEGEPVARMDDALPRLRLREAEARVQRLEIALAQQTRDMERLQQLGARGATSQSQLDDVVTAHGLATQDLAEARIAAERAAVDLDRATVEAPFAGVVVERLIEVGEYAAAGARVARVVNTEAREARAQTPIDAAPFVREGDALTVSDDAHSVSAPVSARIAVGDVQTRTFEVRVDLSDADWIIGAPVRLSVPVGVAREAVCVPRDALVLRSSGAHIMRISEENVAERVAVAPGVGAGDWIEVTGEVAPGDRVVVRGAENLRDGQAVAVLDTEQAATRATTSQTQKT